ncbi:hypothetical protein Glove_344g13 [Diversispora epigaea]|uniref:Uncharacterized protein n=1 Tax=Diversispora epigaea TaxID=1348612 RepID=A0A397HFY3_9GLOM|nr:hypothetical protein Glove_344g13 [Diversispora epigaea]
MVYTDNCPVLNDIEWRDNCQFPVICDGETPSDWKKRIWGQLINYRKNNCLSVSHKRYMVARKMLYLWEGDLGSGFEVNIAICHSCDQLVYVDRKCIYGEFHRSTIEKHWRTNCTGSKYCDMDFKEYMELKDKPRDSIPYFTARAVDRYELRIENLVKRVKHIRETAKKIRATKIIQQKWLEIFYRPDGLCATQLAKHYKLLWAVREEIRQINNA